MLRQNVLGTSGLVLALVAGTAQAQTSVNDRTQQNQQTTTNRLTTTYSQGELLRQLEGVWRVDVTINDRFWKMGQNGMDRSMYERPDYNKPGTTDRTTDQINKDKTGQNQYDRNQTDRNQTDRTQPDKNNSQDQTRIGQPERDMTPGYEMASRTFTGYAQGEKILGGDVVRETLVIPDLSTQSKPIAQRDTTNPGAGDTTNSGEKNPWYGPGGKNETAQNEPNKNPGQPVLGTNTPGLEQGSFRAISFLNYEPETNQYRLVVMDSSHRGMHYLTGSADASGQTITFHSEGDSMSPMYNRTNDSWRQNNLNDRDNNGLRNDHDNGLHNDLDNDNDDWRNNQPDSNRSTNDTNRDTTGQSDRTQPGQDTGNDLQSQRDRTTTTQPYERRDMTTGMGSMDSGEYRTVIEVLSPDRHRVTVYRVGGTLINAEHRGMPQPGWTDQNENNNSSDRLNDNRLNQNEQNQTDRNDQTDRNQTENRTGLNAQNRNQYSTSNQPWMAEGAEMIYQATYTRASGSDEATYRRLIERDTQR